MTEAFHRHIRARVEIGLLVTTFDEDNVRTACLAGPLEHLGNLKQYVHIEVPLEISTVQASVHQESSGGLSIGGLGRCRHEIDVSDELTAVCSQFGAVEESLIA